MINLTVDENHVIQDVHFTGGCKNSLRLQEHIMS